MLIELKNDDLIRHKETGMIATLEGWLEYYTNELRSRYGKAPDTIDIEAYFRLYGIESGKYEVVRNG